MSASSSILSSSLSYSPQDKFYLISPTRKIVTEGCFKRICTPAQDASDLNGEFQCSLKNALEEARAAGIEEPLVVGAVPFDVTQPSALFIPNSWRSLSVEEVHAYGAKQNDYAIELLSIDSIPEHSNFLSIVSEAIDRITHEGLKKVVLSRLLEIQAKNNVDSEALLGRLAMLNSNAYNFHVPLPDGGYLVGSSPELLASQQGEKFMSIPLAGTAKRDSQDWVKDTAVAQGLLSSQKDRYEHRLVIDSMRQTLESSKKITEMQFPDTPKCISTPKVWHLATEIAGSLVNSSDNALSLACLLHPTPALNGFPHDVARKMISELEPFNREYFGGIVGCCDAKGDGEWAVAIRCGKVKDDKIRLFAGAGIVGDSIPESEWRETGVKLSTMLHAFGLPPKE